jgi:hypothetical protein
MNSVLAKSHSLNIIYTGRQENHTCLFCETIQQHLIDFISFLFVPVYPNVRTNFAHHFFSSNHFVWLLMLKNNF